jgi:hypothetical protein
MEELLNGRERLRCECGEELWIEGFQSADGRMLGRFMECKCGSEDPIHRPPGSVFGSIAGVGPQGVWGPRGSPQRQPGPRLDSLGVEGERGAAGVDPNAQYPARSCIGCVGLIRFGGQVSYAGAGCLS